MKARVYRGEFNKHDSIIVEGEEGAIISICPVFDGEISVAFFNRLVELQSCGYKIKFEA